MASIARIGDEAPTVSRRPSGPDRDGLAAFRTNAAGRATSLTSLIESEIIPRLMIAHAGDFSTLAGPDGVGVIEAADVDAIVPLALHVDADALLAHVEAILARGVTVDSVMVDLLAPAARRLGEDWEADRCDFVDVTMGLWRLQEIVHEIAARVPADRLLAAGGRRALFAAMPGDQHNFGTVVIDEIFRRDGWLTERISDAEPPELIKRAAENWYDLIGLTVSCDCHTAMLPGLIGALRSVSRNPRVCVMVGGRIFAAEPELALRIGADGTARDARLALKTACGLVRAREEEAAELN